MKKIVISILILSILSVSGIVFAEEYEIAVGTAKGIAGPSEPSPYTIDYDDDNFSITLNENPTTGYMWEYTMNDEKKVSFVEDNFIAADTELVGAGGQHKWTFSALEDGVSTITFVYKRSWEEEAAETMRFLLYNKDGKMIVEEDLIVTIDTEEAKPFIENPEGTIGITEPMEIDNEMSVVSELAVEKVGFFQSIANFFARLFHSIFG